MQYVQRRGEFINRWNESVFTVLDHIWNFSNFHHYVASTLFFKLVSPIADFKTSKHPILNLICQSEWVPPITGHDTGVDWTDRIRSREIKFKKGIGYFWSRYSNKTHFYISWVSRWCESRWTHWPRCNFVFLCNSRYELSWEGDCNTPHTIIL